MFPVMQELTWESLIGFWRISLDDIRDSSIKKHCFDFTVKDDRTFIFYDVINKTETKGILSCIYNPLDNSAVITLQSSGKQFVIRQLFDTDNSFLLYMDEQFYSAKKIL